MSGSSRPTSLAIANEFIRRARAENVKLTHMQVQKLVYFAHGFMLAAFGVPLISDQFEAWRFGPVARSLYDSLKRYGKNVITREICYGDDTPFFSDDDGEPVLVALEQKESDVVDLVYKEFGRLQAFQLSALTHEAGSPWDKAHRIAQNQPIDNEDIKSHFAQLVSSPVH